MSGWDGYVNDMMKDTGLFDNAGIFAKNTCSEWATTENFMPSISEVQALLDAASSQKQMVPEILVVNGIDYVPHLVESSRIYAERKDNKNAGLLVSIGQQCVIVGTYPSAIQPGMAVAALESLMVYLNEQGF